MEHLLLIFFLVLFIVISGILSASETSLFSLSSFTLRAYHSHPDTRKRIVFRLLQNPRELLVTILMLNVLANILVQNVISNLFEGRSGWLKVGLPLLLTLVFGEIVPKSIALPNHTKIAPFIAPFIAFCARILGPFRSSLTRVTSYISRVLFFFLKKEKPIAEEELEEVLKDSEKKGVLNKEEAELMKGYLSLRYATVRELMRPKEEILFYDLEHPLKELEILFLEKECSRVPVCKGDLENLLGILSVRRYLFSGHSLKLPHDLRKIIKKPFYTPETTSAWSLFEELREKQESLAMVVDEYGSITGLITQEDLVEAVIGEISDRKDSSKLYTRSGEDVIIASGKLELSELEDLFEAKFKNKSGAVTLGGWLIEQLGDIPQTGMKYVTDDFLFYVLASEPNRVKRVYVRCLKSPKKRRKT